MTVIVTINEDYAFERQGYSLLRDVDIDGQVVRLDVYLDWAFADQSHIEARLFSDGGFTSIATLRGTAEAVGPLIVSPLAVKEIRREALNAVARLLLDRVTRILGR